LPAPKLPVLASSSATAAALRRAAALKQRASHRGSSPLPLQPTPPLLFSSNSASWHRRQGSSRSSMVGSRELRSRSSGLRGAGGLAVDGRAASLDAGVGVRWGGSGLSVSDSSAGPPDPHRPRPASSSPATSCSGCCACWHHRAGAKRLVGVH
jgi:hypothetical protein